MNNRRQPTLFELHSRPLSADEKPDFGTDQRASVAGWSCVVLGSLFFWIFGLGGGFLLIGFVVGAFLLFRGGVFQGVSMMLCSFLSAWIWIAGLTAYKGYRMAKLFHDVTERVAPTDQSEPSIRLDGFGVKLKK